MLAKCSLVLDFLSLRNLEVVLTMEEEILTFHSIIIISSGLEPRFRLSLGRIFFRKVSRGSGQAKYAFRGQIIVSSEYEGVSVNFICYI